MFFSFIILFELLFPVACRKTVIITGGNRGIGLAAAKQLSTTNDFDIILACRNIELGKKALQLIPAQGRGNVQIQELDLGNLKSIRNFAEKWKKEKKICDILACNAGVQHTGNKGGTVIRTSDGFEDTVGVNHIGHVYLIQLLMNQINKDNGRIVLVGSGVHNPDEPGGNVGSKATLGDLSGLQNGFQPPISMVDGSAYDPDKSYKDSKLCNVMTTLELARRFKQNRSKITVNTLNPGLIPTTGLFRDLNPIFVVIFSFLTKYIFKVAVSEDEGGRRLAFMISNPLLNNVSGAYYSGKPGVSEFLPISPSKEAVDEKKGKLLYDYTLKIVNSIQK